MRKTHSDRVALIDRLEKKYMKKVQLEGLKKKQQKFRQSLRQLHDIEWYEDMQDSMNDGILRIRHTAI